MLGLGSGAIGRRARGGWPSGSLNKGELQEEKTEARPRGPSTPCLGGVGVDDADEQGEGVGVRLGLGGVEEAPAASSSDGDRRRGAWVTPEVGLPMDVAVVLSAVGARTGASATGRYVAVEWCRMGRVLGAAALLLLLCFVLTSELEIVTVFSARPKWCEVTLVT